MTDAERIALLTAERDEARAHWRAELVHRARLARALRLSVNANAPLVAALEAVQRWAETPQTVPARIRTWADALRPTVEAALLRAREATRGVPPDGG